MVSNPVIEILVLCITHVGNATEEVSFSFTVSVQEIICSFEGFRVISIDNDKQWSGIFQSLAESLGRMFLNNVNNDRLCILLKPFGNSLKILLPTVCCQLLLMDFNFEFGLVLQNLVDWEAGVDEGQQMEWAVFADAVYCYCWLL